jgi:hypothetical protein
LGLKKQLKMETISRSIRAFIVGGLAILTLSACSIIASPKYDEVELLEYQACLSQVTSKAPSGFSGAGNEIEGILKWCESLKPAPTN